jgi:SSS family solute:Na+ symporter/sodium/proline symporter
MGGYKSVAMIDVFFGVIMVVGVVILLFTTLKEGGGLSRILADLSEINSSLVSVVGPPGFWSLFTLVFLTSVAPFAMPQLLQKFVAIKDKKAIKKGAITSSVFALLIGSIAYFVGTTTRIFVTPEEFPEVFIDGMPIYDRLMPELLGHVVPSILSSLMLLLILAASMSSLASMVLTSSSTFVKDLYEISVKNTPSDQQISRISQIANVVFVALSILLALGNFDSIVVVMGISWGALGSVFLGPVFWGLYGNPKNFRKKGAIVASIVGLVVCLGLFALGRPSPEAGTIGMLTSFFCPLVFGLVTKVQVKKNS